VNKIESTKCILEAGVWCLIKATDIQKGALIKTSPIGRNMDTTINEYKRTQKNPPTVWELSRGITTCPGPWLEKTHLQILGYEQCAVLCLQGEEAQHWMLLGRKIDRKIVPAFAKSTGFQQRWMWNLISHFSKFCTQINWWGHLVF
jgi:hypothetical protein